MKLSSFAIGRYAMSTVVCVVGFLHRAFAMFPIVKYTGQALLSPWNWESWVLSDDKIRGTMVYIQHQQQWIKMRDSQHYWAIIRRSSLHLQGKPLSLYKHIAAESLHLYGQDPVSKTGIFCAPLLQTLINKVWFKNKEDEGIIHPKFSENDTLSKATIAFVLTVVSLVLQNCIQVVYKTLNSANKPFRLKTTWTNGSPVIMSTSLSLLQPTRPGNVKGWPWGLVGFCDFFKGFLIISQILGQMLYFIERKWSYQYY